MSLGHFPSPAPRDKNGGKQPCQLCRWAAGRHVCNTKDTSYCDECGVTLCLGNCYRKFHIVWDLVGEREGLCKYVEEKAGCPGRAKKV